MVFSLPASAPALNALRTGSRVYKRAILALFCDYYRPRILTRKKCNRFFRYGYPNGYYSTNRCLLAFEYHRILVCRVYRFALANWQPIGPEKENNDGG